LNPSEEELEGLVEAGELSEDQALALLEPGLPKPKRNGNSKDINAAHQSYMEKELDENAFYKALLQYITTVVKSHSPDRATFSVIEDAISITALKIWKNLTRFEPKRSSFSRFVTVVALSQIRSLIGHARPQRAFRKLIENGQTLYACRECDNTKSEAFAFCEACGNEALEKSPTFRVSLEEAEVLPAKGLSPERQTLFNDWMAHLDDTDRTIAKLAMDGLTQEEMGQALGISQQAVAKRLKRLADEEKPPF
jgi:RNA polymerase sigma factor (sigma-70 family)